MRRNRDDEGRLIPGEYVQGEVVAGHFVDGEFLPDVAAPPSYPIAPPASLADHLAAPSDIEATAQILGARNVIARNASRAAPPPRPGGYRSRSLRKV